MAKSATPRGVEDTGFADKKLIENCPLVITTIECRNPTKDKKTYDFDYTIAGDPKDKDALFLKDIRESTRKEEGSGFFSTRTVKEESSCGRTGNTFIMNLGLAATPSATPTSTVQRSAITTSAR